jgi:hypothetical protein
MRTMEINTGPSAICGVREMTLHNSSKDKQGLITKEGMEND